MAVKQPPYRESQHPRGAGGRWRQTASGQMPSAVSSVQARAMVLGGAVMLAVGVFQVLTAAANLLTAVLTVATLLVLVAGGVMTRRQGRAAVRRTVARAAQHRRTGGASRSPAAEKARTDRELRLREQRWQRRDSARERRRVAWLSWWEHATSRWRTSRVTSRAWDRREEESDGGPSGG